MKKISIIAACISLIIGAAAHAEINKYNIISPVIISNTIKDDSNNEKPEETPNPSGWLAFFHSKGSLSQLTSLEQWKDAAAWADLDNQGLTNGDLPKGNLGVSQIHELYMAGNNIKNVNFLNGVEYAEKISINNNLSLSDLSGLSHLKRVDDLDFSNTSVTDIRPLSNLTTVGVYTIGENVNDLSPIKNIGFDTYGSTAFIVRIALKQEYIGTDSFANGKPDTLNLPFVSPFCQSLNQDMGSIYTWTKPVVYFKNSFACQSNHAWLNVMHSGGTLLNTIGSENIGKGGGHQKIIFNENIIRWDNSVIPSSPIPMTMPASGNQKVELTLSSTHFSDINFMSNTRGFESITLTGDNDLTDISGLGNATYINKVTITNNNLLSSLSSLSSVKTPAVLKITGNANLETLNGLQNITKAGSNIEINNNPKLTDIGALSNLYGHTSSTKSLNVYTDAIVNKLPSSSITCDSILNYRVYFFNRSNGDQYLPYNDVCQ